jgi:hypothetical protein
VIQHEAPLRGSDRYGKRANCVTQSTAEKEAVFRDAHRLKAPGARKKAFIKINGSVGERPGESDGVTLRKVVRLDAYRRYRVRHRVKVESPRRRRYLIEEPPRPHEKM